jgi:FHA domain
VTSWSAVPASPSPLGPSVPSDRPGFLDWFKSPAPEPEPEPAPEPEPETVPPALLKAPADSKPPWEQLPAEQLPAEQPPAEQLPEEQPPAGDLAADEPAPDEPKPLDEPVLAETADAFSWSARRVLPRSSAAPTAPIPKFTPTTWSIVVTSDRTYYDQMQIERARMGWDLAFPAYTAERRFPLAGKQMRIGRRSAARGVEPEIDLSVPPADPGISRLHALLIAAPDGAWAVLDPGSANGTLLNGREIAPGDLIPLRDGDRINLGAWTAITVHRE